MEKFGQWHMCVCMLILCMWNGVVGFGWRVEGREEKRGREKKMKVGKCIYKYTQIYEIYICVSITSHITLGHFILVYQSQQSQKMHV